MSARIAHLRMNTKLFPSFTLTFLYTSALFLSLFFLFLSFPPLVVNAQSPVLPNCLTGCLYNLDLSAPTSHGATTVAGAVANSGYATFTGVQGGSYLALNSAADTNGTPFPTTIGGAATSLSLHFWILLNGVNGDQPGGWNHQLFSCGSTTSSGNDGIRIQNNNWNIGLTVGIYQAGSYVCGATDIQYQKFPLNSWVPLTLTFASNGQWRVYWGGALAHSATCGAANPILAVSRASCRVSAASWSLTGGAFEGGIAAMQLYDHVLTTVERDQLHAEPPPALPLGEITFKGIPRYAVVGAVYVVTVSTSLCISPAIDVNWVWTSATASVALLSFTGLTCLPQQFTLTLGACPGWWNGTISLTGSLANLFTPPPPISILQWTYERMYESSVFRLGITGPGTRSTFAPGITPNNGPSTGWIEFDGSTQQYFNLSSTEDTRGATLTSHFGGGAGLSFNIWVMIHSVSYGWPTGNPGGWNHKLFSCSLSPTSSNNYYFIGNNNWNNGITFAMNVGAGSGYCGTTDVNYNKLPLNAWFQVTYTIDWYGTQQYWIAGQSVYSSMCGAATWQTFRTPQLFKLPRYSCTLGAMSWAATDPSQGHFAGAISAFEYYDRPLSAAEVNLLGSLPPPQPH